MCNCLQPTPHSVKFSAAWAQFDLLILFHLRFFLSLRREADPRSKLKRLQKFISHFRREQNQTAARKRVVYLFPHLIFKLVDSQNKPQSKGNLFLQYVDRCVTENSFRRGHWGGWGGGCVWGEGGICISSTALLYKCMYETFIHWSDGANTWHFNSQILDFIFHHFIWKQIYKKKVFSTLALTFKIPDIIIFSRVVGFSSVF